MYRYHGRVTFTLPVKFDIECDDPESFLDRMNNADFWYYIKDQLREMSGFDDDQANSFEIDIEDVEIETII